MGPGLGGPRGAAPLPGIPGTGRAANIDSRDDDSSLPQHLRPRVQAGRDAADRCRRQSAPGTDSSLSPRWGRTPAAFNPPQSPARSALCRPAAGRCDVTQIRALLRSAISVTAAPPDASPSSLQAAHLHAKLERRAACEHRRDSALIARSVSVLCSAS